MPPEIHPYKEAVIWNKFALGILAIATIAAARAVLRHRSADALAEETSPDVADVANLYAAGL